jgi:hypothetical protein
MNRYQNLALAALSLALWAAPVFAKDAAPAKPKACCSAEKKSACCQKKSACCKDDDARGKCAKTGKPKLQCCASKASQMPPCCQKNCPPKAR